MTFSPSNTDFDVAVIGAGLIGLSAADSLLSKGLSVCVSEIKVAPMTGASFSNSGMIHPSQSVPWAQLGLDIDARLSVGADVLSLANRSRDLTAARANALGLAQTTRPEGCLQLFPNSEAWAQACARYDALGIAYQRRPAGRPFGDAPAVFFPDDRSGNAYDYGLALAADITARGAKFITGQGASPWVEDGRIIGVRLGNHDIRAKHTVLAAGMQSARLAKRAGVDLPMKRVVGWAVNFARPKDFDLPGYPVMDGGQCSALSVFGDVVRLSGTIDAPSAERLIDIWTELAPELMAELGGPIGEPWRGERPVSLTGKPFIGRSRLPGLWVNAGHGHMGWTLCAGSGELLADMIAEGRPDTRFDVPVKLS